MKKLTRLPNGYKERVTEAKKICRKLVDDLNNGIKNKTIESSYEVIVNILASMKNVVNISCYDDLVKNIRCAHIDFDMILVTQLGIDICPYIRVYSDHVELGETCAIFLCKCDEDNNELMVDSYKW